MDSHDDDAEREQIEWVFGLTGGELNDEPWRGFAYNYDGVPEYAAEDFDDRYSNDVEYRTVVASFLFSPPPSTLVDDDGAWKLVAIYRSSGECECPLRPERVEEDRCPLCDEETGEPHGYIYLGDGWAEAVYRLELTDDDD